MKRRQNLLLILAIVALTVFPLLYVQKPAPDAEGNVAGIFSGADNQARDLIGVINPDYTPWFASLMEPPSGELASLLFALQAALGAGFIGYYLGVSVTRERMQREAQMRTEKHTEKQTHAD